MLLDSFEPLGLVPAISKLLEYLDTDNYSQAKNILEQYPKLKDPDIYAYFYQTESLYPVLRYIDTLNEKNCYFYLRMIFYLVILTLLPV